MDWENKHFPQETALTAPRAKVAEALRPFAERALPDWSVTQLPDGLDASGRSGFHHAEAHLRLADAPEGTRVVIELQVRRRNATGYMLFDLAGYYDALLRKWLHALWEQLGDSSGPSMQAPYGAHAPDATVGARVVVLDAQGNALLGEVREVGERGVRVAFDSAEERWVPATAAHVVTRRASV
jgi:hypothetical protein